MVFPNPFDDLWPLIQCEGACGSLSYLQTALMMCYDVAGNPVSFIHQIILFRLGSKATPKCRKRGLWHHFASILNIGDIRSALIAFLSRKIKN
jgi:hypothetical protein